MENSYNLSGYKHPRDEELEIGLEGEREASEHRLKIQRKQR
jgi:hypothetical protein